MDRSAPRDLGQRKADTLAKLGTLHLDGWVSSANAAGVAHLVPLSIAWADERIVIAVEESSVTCRNITASGRVRIGLGPTRDVVMLDLTLDRVVPAADAPAGIAGRYAAQSDWDPRSAGPGYVYLVLCPRRIQAWREANEIPGRTLMRGGAWL